MLNYESEVDADPATFCMKWCIQTIGRHPAVANTGGIIDYKSGGSLRKAVCVKTTAFSALGFFLIF